MDVAIFVVVLLMLFFVIGIYGAINGFVVKLDAFVKGLNEELTPMVEKLKRSQDPRFD